MNTFACGRFSLILLLSVSAVTGCATKVDKYAFHEVALKQGEVLPGKGKQKAERAQVVVLETELRSPIAVYTQSGDAFAMTIEKELNDSGSEIVDRKLATVLGNELKLAEFNGTGNYTGPQVAQYAIRGQIHTAEYAVTKSAQLLAKLFKSKSDLPVRFDHKVTVKGAVKIYELPSLRLLGAINVTGTASENDMDAGENTATQAALLKAAISYAISDQSHELKNFFAPKGYVTERRANAYQSMFKVLAGRELGMKAGSTVVIFSPRKVDANAISTKESVEEVEVAQGYVSDKVGDGVSWIVVDDLAASDRVKLGDYVKVRYDENSVFTKILR